MATLVGLGIVIGTLFLPWRASLTGIQRLMVDNLFGFFASLGDVMAECTPVYNDFDIIGVACLFGEAATILILLGGVLCVVGVWRPLAGLVGAGFGISAPVCIIIWDLFSYNLDQTGIGVYLCIVGFAVVFITGILQLRTAEGLNAHKNKTKYGKYVV